MRTRGGGRPSTWREAPAEANPDLGLRPPGPLSRLPGLGGFLRQPELTHAESVEKNEPKRVSKDTSQAPEPIRSDRRGKASRFAYWAHQGVRFHAQFSHSKPLPATFPPSVFLKHHLVIIFISEPSLEDTFTDLREREKHRSVASHTHPTGNRTRSLCCAG